MTTIDAPLDSAPVTRVAADTRYVLTGFPVGTAATIVCSSGFALGLGLAVIGIGVPILAATLVMARGLAVTERARVARVLGEPVTAPAYRAATSDTVVSRLLAAVLDPRSWRDLAHAVLRFIPSTVAFSVVVTWLAGMAGGFSWALWGWALPDGGTELAEMLGFGDAYPTTVVWHLVVGVLFAVTLPAVARWAAVLEARFARALL